MKISKHFNRKLFKKSKTMKKVKDTIIYKKCKCVHSGCNEEKTMMEMMSEELYMVME